MDEERPDHFDQQPSDFRRRRGGHHGKWGRGENDEMRPHERRSLRERKEKPFD